MTQKYPKPGERFIPPESVPDTLKVPENTIYVIPYDNVYKNVDYIQKPDRKRAWFTQHFYFCLPLIFGNQHGFIVRSRYDFVVRWTGSPNTDGVIIHPLEDIKPSNFMALESHFGSGILTIQTTFMLRTPNNINLMVKEPPNYPIAGFSWMNAMVETDNLRRDFTFNIKITIPHRDIYVKKGTPIGCVVPYPRYFHDPFELEELRDPEELDKAQRTSRYFGVEREEYDQGLPGFRYLQGEDIYGFKFEHHQKTLDGGAWWRSVREKMQKRQSSDDSHGIPVQDDLADDKGEVPGTVAIETAKMGAQNGHPTQENWLDQFFEEL